MNKKINMRAGVASKVIGGYGTVPTGSGRGHYRCIL